MIACSIPDYVKMIPEKKRLVYAVATNFFVLCIEISTFQHWWYILYTIHLCAYIFLQKQELHQVRVYPVRVKYPAKDYNSMSSSRIQTRTLR